MPFLKSPAQRWSAVGLSLAFVLVATLVPAGGQVHGFAGCVFCNPRALADGLVNVALFAPLGLSLRLVGRGFLSATTLGGATSLLIELAQLRVPGRDPTLSDIIANTTGAAFGALLLTVVPWLARPDRRTSERLALVAAGMACVVWGLTGYLLAPSMPNSPYWGQWTPVLEGLVPYKGRVLSASVGEIPVPPGAIEASAALRARLMAGAPVGLHVIVGPPPSGSSAIFSIADGDSKRVLLVGAVGHDLLFRYRTRAGDWHLDQPILRDAHAFASTGKGTTTEVSIRKESDGYCLAVGERETCGFGYGAGDGWSLLVSSVGTTQPTRRVFQALWMALIVSPVGFWARPGRRFALTTGILVGGLLVVPELTVLHPAKPNEWVGAGLGVAVAAAAGRRWI